MESEIIKTFDEHGNYTGTASRDEVHKNGLWHETFHCWFLSRERGKNFLYFQIRSKDKKDYPDLLDITAAGHLLAHETVEDGIREIEEELGVTMSFVELASLGIIRNSIITETMSDNELSHVFVLKFEDSLTKFNLQKEEVAGIVRIDLDDFEDLWFGDAEEIHAEGFVVDHDGKKVTTAKLVRKSDFVKHEDSYFQHVIERIREILK